MNKKIHFIYIGIIILLILISIFYILDFKKESPSLTENQLRELALPEITKHCNYIEEKSTSSNCPTCYWKYFEEFQITITKIDENFQTELTIPIIYGRNTRTGELTVEITFNKEGKIIFQNFPEPICL